MAPQCEARRVPAGAAARATAGMAAAGATTAGMAAAGAATAGMTAAGAAPRSVGPVPAGPATTVAGGLNEVYPATGVVAVRAVLRLACLLV
jgi:hypothetical protein